MHSIVSTAVVPSAYCCYLVEHLSCHSNYSALNPFQNHCFHYYDVDYRSLEISTYFENVSQEFRPAFESTYMLVIAREKPTIVRLDRQSLASYSSTIYHSLNLSAASTDLKMVNRGFYYLKSEIWFHEQMSKSNKRHHPVRGAKAYLTIRRGWDLELSVVRETIDLCHYYSMHFELVPYLVAVVVAVAAAIDWFLMAVVVAVAAADAYYWLMMALVVTLIEYVALELVAAASTVYGKSTVNLIVWGNEIPSNGIYEQFAQRVA